MFINFKNIEKDYEAIILGKGFTEKEKLTIHFSGKKDLNFFSSMISGKITIKDKTYTIILDEDKVIDKYEGGIIDPSPELKHSIIAEIYFSKNFKEIYCYFKEDGTFIVAPTNNIEEMKSFFHDRGIK